MVDSVNGKISTSSGYAQAFIFASIGSIEATFKFEPAIIRKTRFS